jgi:hypothetical protein
MKQPLLSAGFSNAGPADETGERVGFEEIGYESKI